MFHGFSDGMFDSQQKVKFHQFKNGEHNFRILPPFAKDKLYHQVDLHWGFLDANGQKKVLTCTKFQYKTCAICDEADKLTEQVKMLEKAEPSQAGFSTKEELDIFLGETKKKRDDIKRKSTYLWNIMVDGTAKVLQLSWNGHEPLMNKVKFIWEKQKINVTDPNACQLMYCQRTGQSAQTRYTYELINNSAIPLSGTGIESVVDLAAIYTLNTPSEIAQVMKLGYVPNTTSDPNDRDFAAPPADSAPANNQQASQPANNQPVNQPAQNTQTPANNVQTPQNNIARPDAHQQAMSQTQTASPTNQVNTTNVDDDIAKMEAILKQGNQGVF